MLDGLRYIQSRALIAADRGTVTDYLRVGVHDAVNEISRGLNRLVNCIEKNVKDLTACFTNLGGGVQVNQPARVVHIGHRNHYQANVMARGGRDDRARGA